MGATKKGGEDGRGKGKRKQERNYFVERTERGRKGKKREGEGKKEEGNEIGEGKKQEQRGREWDKGKEDRRVVGGRMRIVEERVKGWRLGREGCRNEGVVGGREVRGMVKEHSNCEGMGRNMGRKVYYLSVYLHGSERQGEQESDYFSAIRVKDAKRS